VFGSSDVADCYVPSQQIMIRLDCGVVQESKMLEAKSMVTEVWFKQLI
jgi:hypothetical protein